MANNEMMANVRGGALVGAGFGGIIGAVIGWLMGAHMVAVPVVGPVVGQGVLSTALVAAVAGVAAGALLGGLVGVFSPTPDLESAEDTVVVAQNVQNVPADTVVGGGPALAQVPAPLLNASPVPEAELEAQQLLYPTSGMGIATPDAGVNPFAVTLEHEAILTRPVKVTAPLVPPTEEQLAPLPAVPVKVTAPLVQQEEAAVAPIVEAQVEATPQAETLPISGSWVTFDPDAAPQESIVTDTATAETQAEVATASTSTPLMRVKRRRRIMPAGDEQSPGE